MVLNFANTMIFFYNINYKEGFRKKNLLSRLKNFFRLEDPVKFDEHCIDPSMQEYANFHFG